MVPLLRGRLHRIRRPMAWSWSPTASRSTRYRPRRQYAVAAQPRRAGHGAGAVRGRSGRRLGRLVRIGRRRPGALRVRRDVAGPGRADRGRGRPLLRGHVQRVAVAALPRRRREARVPPRLVGHLRAGQQALRRARRGRRRRGRHRLGARLPAATGPGAAPSERPDLTIGFFLHIPFPPYELFTQLPWRSAIVEGLLGADLVGFQRPAAATNFVQLARRLHDLPARGPVIEYDGRTVAARAFPISIDVAAFDAMARMPETVEALRRGEPRRHRPHDDRSSRKTTRTCRTDQRRGRRGQRRLRRPEPAGDGVEALLDVDVAVAAAALAPSPLLVAATSTARSHRSRPAPTGCPGAWRC